MILFENSILKLNYNPATDIVEVVYPDLHDYLVPEIKYSIDKLVVNVKNYDIKKLLLDSTNTKVLIDAAESSEIALYLAAGLANTRLQKVARLQSSSSDIEKNAGNNIRKAQETISLPFELKNFTSKAEALQWLSA
ncbi:MAG: hypothetical protein LPJ89_11610 [Hymenobacteraceae bacterium]|nr:hypothetical protein [Hymenobacteraceae bacterium]MDX5396645.1 hypothetical protein [Hymenobacteraceae bacterium]MDX5444413.1 hypothetical protein [Hymenobacteraceae bacterium]MDX5512712.1 hypothetical protein [Hymenobacteraceae bacterium]